MSVSGRAGLFTIKDFNPNLTDQVEATTRGQKSGALRLEFGKVTVPAMSTTVVTVRTTVDTGITAVATFGKLPVVTGSSGAPFVGNWTLATSSFLSGTLSIDVRATGQFSGQLSGMDINYIVVGY